MESRGEMEAGPRFETTHQGVRILEYKIIDQNQKEIKELDREEFEGIGFCSLISLSANSIIAKETAPFDILSILKQLRDNSLISTCKDVIKALKGERREYVKTHRYQFHKDQKSLKEYMKSTTNDLQIFSYLKQLKTQHHRVFYAPKIEWQGESVYQYQTHLKELLGVERVWVLKQIINNQQIKDNKQWQGVTGIFKSQEDHYVSFLVHNKEFHLFNSLDEYCFRDDGVKVIINQLMEDKLI